MSEENMVPQEPMIGENEAAVAEPVQKESYRDFKLEKIPYDSGLSTSEDESEGVSTDVAYPVTEKEAESSHTIQTKEDNAKYAAARREAEGEAKKLREEREADAQMAGFSSYAEMQKFIRDQKETTRKADLQEKGVDVDALKATIRQEIEADPVYSEYKRTVQNTALQASIQKLNDEWGTNFKEPNDLLDMPNYDKFYSYVVDKGLSFGEAYKLVAFDPKKAIANASAQKQATINQTSKGHIRPSNVSESASDFKDVLPPDILREWDKNKKHFPNKTLADFARLYNKLK